jgi:hypothetical protein
MRDTEAQRAAKATEYLIESAGEIAAASADLVRAENMLRVVKAMVMKTCGEKSVAAQEVAAYASPQYLQAVNDLVATTQAYEELRAKRDAAKARIEYWRSFNANQRAAERGFGSAA